MGALFYLLYFTWQTLCSCSMHSRFWQSTHTLNVYVQIDWMCWILPNFCLRPSSRTTLIPTDKRLNFLTNMSFRIVHAQEITRKFKLPQHLSTIQLRYLNIRSALILELWVFQWNWLKKCQFSQSFVNFCRRNEHFFFCRRFFRNMSYISRIFFFSFGTRIFISSNETNYPELIRRNALAVCFSLSLR